MATPELKVFIGIDPRQQDAYLVAEHSLRRHASIRLDIRPLVLEQLRWKSLYARPHEVRDGKLWDAISAQPLSTEFNLTRFLVPALADWKGWALYFDCDFLWRADVAGLLEHAEERRALLCVNHHHVPAEKEKMDRQAQRAYDRKNWSSLVLWNCAHLLHAGQVERVNRWPRDWLHQFRWLPGWPEIGFLPLEWNWLEGVSEPLDEPKAVHFTRGLPSVPGYEHCAFAEAWREELAMAQGQRS